MNQDKKILISGIQPTNKLTLGNYLGAIKAIIEDQHKHETIFFVADLHARTLPLTYYSYDYKKLQQYTLDVVRMYVALGIDIKKTRVFIQSNIKEHLELFYFLVAHSSLGELRRMTQYKFLLTKLKEPNQTESALMGILLYPLLMAADILLYSADYISVGKDQEQHLELASALAQRINERYKTQLFKLPEKLVRTGNQYSSKIMDLQCPDKKMSKTCDSPDGVIFLTDSPEVVRSKIMKTKTDSINKVNKDIDQQPGIFNLVVIYSSINNLDLDECFVKFKDSNYKDLKTAVADSVCELLATIQSNYEKVDMEIVTKELEAHSEFCSAIARKKLNEIYSVV